LPVAAAISSRLPESYPPAEETCNVLLEQCAASTVRQPHRCSDAVEQQSNGAREFVRFRTETLLGIDSRLAPPPPKVFIGQENNK